MKKIIIFCVYKDNKRRIIGFYAGHSGSNPPMSSWTDRLDEVHNFETRDEADKMAKQINSEIEPDIYVAEIEGVTK